MYGPDYISQQEFRIFLVALKQRFEFWEAFKKSDSENDRRISLQEFSACLGQIEAWVGEIVDAEIEFNIIDKSGIGEILFDDFCKWALHKHLDKDTDEAAN